MGRVCMVTGKKVMVGNNVSHANNRTKRTFEVNLQNVSLMSDILKRPVSLRVSTRGLRTIEHNGGLDNYVLSTPTSRLSLDFQKIKKQLKKIQKS